MPPVSSLSKGEKTQIAIRDAAFALIVEQGYAATSMRQIAERAGLALGSIYNHYPSKEAIFEEIILAYHPFRQILPAIVSAEGDTFEQFLTNAAQSLVEGLKNNPAFLNLILVEFVEFKGQHAGKILNLVLPEILKIIARIDTHKDKLRDIPTPLLLRTFMGTFFSYYFSDLLLSGDTPFEFKQNSFEAFVNVYLHGILKPTDMEQP
jgi:AcrR family transcriptional regulator